MSDNPRVYNLYGLRVYSEVELPAAIATSDLAPYDLQIGWGERKADSSPALPEQILATLTLDNGRGYVLANTGSSYNLCFHQTCEFEIASDLRSVTVHLLGEVQPDIAALLLVGNVMACMLTLAGEPVLHASTVEIRDMAIAFVGASGMGKSTLAALLCANGARFVTDDLLRLKVDGKGFLCYGGTGQIRLRKTSAALADGFARAANTVTPDDRIAVQMDKPASMPRLGAIIVPKLSRKCKMLNLKQLSLPEALIHLMAFPRIQGIKQGQYLQHQIDAFGRIAENTPIFEAEIPWGVPLPQEFASNLIEGVCGLEG